MTCYGHGKAYQNHSQALLSEDYSFLAEKQSLLHVYSHLAQIPRTAPVTGNG